MVTPSFLLGFQQSLLRSSCFHIVQIRAKDLCILVGTLYSEGINVLTFNDNMILNCKENSEKIQVPDGI